MMSPMTTRNESTQATCPKHIWKHEVIVLAVARGADPIVCREIAEEVVSTGQKRLSLWYHTGEPVWMAAETLATMAKQRSIHARAENEVRDLCRLMAKARA
jgi:hypothetical protein